MERIENYKRILKDEFRRYLTIRTLIEIILIGIIISSFFIVGLERIYGPFWDKIFYGFQDKPKVIVHVQEYSRAMPNISTVSPPDLLTLCNTKALIINSIVTSPNLEDIKDFNIPYSFSTDTYYCKLANGTDCSLYAFDIRNLGEASTKSLILDVSTSSKTIEFGPADPKITFSENTGYRGQKKFRAEIAEIRPMETVGFRIKLEPDSNINTECKVNGDPDLCFKIFRKIWKVNLQEGIDIAFLIDGDKIIVNMSNFPNSYNPIFYEFNKELRNYVKADYEIENFACP